MSTFFLCVLPTPYIKRHLTLLFPSGQLAVLRYFFAPLNFHRLSLLSSLGWFVLKSTNILGCFTRRSPTRLAMRRSSLHVALIVLQNIVTPVRHNMTTEGGGVATGPNGVAPPGKVHRWTPKSSSVGPGLGCGMRRGTQQKMSISLAGSASSLVRAIHVGVRTNQKRPVVLCI